MVKQNKQNKQTKQKDMIIDGIRIDKETIDFVDWFWKREQEKKKIEKLIREHNKKVKDINKLYRLYYNDKI